MKYTVLLSVKLDVEMEVEANSKEDAAKQAESIAYTYFADECFDEFGIVNNSSTEVDRVVEAYGPETAVA
jgi:hypothetical protein